MTAKKKSSSQKKYFVGFECNEIQFYWLQYQAKIRGRSLEDLTKEGLSIVRSLPEDLLQLAWLTSMKKNVLLGEMIGNAIRAYLKLPQKRLQKHDYEKVELTIPINQQIGELRAKLLRKKPLKLSGSARVATDAGKIMDTQAHIQKVIGIEERVQEAKK